MISGPMIIGPSIIRKLAFICGGENCELLTTTPFWNFRKETNRQMYGPDRKNPIESYIGKFLYPIKFIILS